MNSVWTICIAFLFDVSFGLDTKMFQLTMPNVRPYRVSEALTKPPKIKRTKKSEKMS